MIGYDCCTFCIHSRQTKIDGWKSSCDAFPDGIPRNFPCGKPEERQECNHGIGYEPNEEAVNWGMD